MSVRSFSRGIASWDFVVCSHGLCKVTTLTREFSRTAFFSAGSCLGAAVLQSIQEVLAARSAWQEKNWGCYCSVYVSFWILGKSFGEFWCLQTNAICGFILFVVCRVVLKNWIIRCTLQPPLVCHQARQGTVPPAKDDLWKFSPANFESARIWPFLSMGNASVIIKNQNKAPCSLCSCFFCIRGVKAIPWSVHMAEKRLCPPLT